MTITPQTIWHALEDVKDPEIPVISVVEMGIVREVEVKDHVVVVTITPTFAGCPALVQIQDDIRERIEAMNAGEVTVNLTLNPAWSTDMISDEGREKLRQFGLAPPPKHGGDVNLMLSNKVECPYCGSSRTSQKNSFGSTSCRAIYYCNHCQQPFEQFKAL